jgi:hypothetical protein
MRRYRDRKARGLVLLPPYHISPAGIARLCENGWLPPGSPIEPQTIHEALRQFINETLAPPQEPKQRMKNLVQTVTNWLF